MLSRRSRGIPTAAHGSSREAPGALKDVTASSNLVRVGFACDGYHVVFPTEM